MLATLRNLFAPQAVAEAMKTMQPLATTVMDTLFKNRPTHPLAMIGKTDLVEVVQTVPVVRRDGSPVALAGDSMSMEFIAPLPIKPEVNVSASELNDLRVMLGNTAALEAWRKTKIEKIRSTIRNTTEGMCAVVMATGKVSWPVKLEGGRTETYEVDYGALPIHTPAAKLSNASKLSDVYHLLRDMEQQIRQAGVGGKVEFFAGRDVVTVLIDLAEASKSTSDGAMYKIELADGKVTIGSYVVRYMDETYPNPNGGAWVSKLDPKTLLGVAVDSPGTIWYCATDSISANNAAVPLHIVPIAKNDDSGITLIGQSKPLPARQSRASCRCIAVD